MNARTNCHKDPRKAIYADEAEIRSRIAIKIQEQSIIDKSVDDHTDDLLDDRLLPVCANVLPDGMFQYLQHLPIINNSEFIHMWAEVRRQKKHIPGCYVIYDCDEDKIYVGKGSDVYSRVKEHFDGKSLPSKKPQIIDYNLCKLRHSAWIRIIEIPDLIQKLSDSNLGELNYLERLLIAAYDCVEPKGYNLTKGNGC